MTPLRFQGHTLDLVFCTGQVDGDLDVKELYSSVLMNRSPAGAGLDLPELTTSAGWGTNEDDPSRFSVALAGHPVKALVDLWNGEVTMDVDTNNP